MSSETIYHTVYKTTNLINGKIYIGVHSTKDPHDGYLGSGKLMGWAVSKHGIENFKKEILHICESKEEAFFIESILVDSEFVNRQDTYNVALGGGAPLKDIEACRRGGYTTYYDKKEGIRKINDDPELKSAITKIAGKNSMKTHKKNETLFFSKEWQQSNKDRLKAEGYSSCSDGGKKGGKMLYINKDGMNKRCHPNELEGFLELGWKRGCLMDRSSIPKKRWVNRDGKSKTVDDIEFDTFIKEGWNVGRG